MGVKVGFGRDTTDDIYIPTRGYVVDVDYEQVTGDEDFGILEGSGVFYKTLYQDFRERKTILSTKILAGTTFSNAPFFENFYAGGIGMYGIRGFEYRGVSTRGLQTNVLNPRRVDPIGSDSIFLANSELTVPLVGDNISALFFVDSGTVDTGPYRISIGTGIQVIVPQVLGPIPIRFTFSDPLQKDDEDDTQSFSFFMGGMF
jgi:outer membrane protein assembly factor BamA